MGSTLEENGELDAEVTHRVQSGWKNWKRAYGLECCATGNEREDQGEGVQDSSIGLYTKTGTGVRDRYMGVEEGTGKEIGGRRNENATMDVRSYENSFAGCCWKLDKLGNERIRGTKEMGEIPKKVQERRLKWYGHVMRREEHYIGRRAMEMKVQGTRKRRCLDKVKDDIKEKRLSADEVYDPATRRSMSLYIDPT